MIKPVKRRLKGLPDSLADHFSRPTFWALIRYAIGGALVGTLLSCLAQYVAHCIELTRNDEALRLIFAAGYFYAGVLVPAFLIISYKANLQRVLSSSRIDLAFAAIAGCALGISFRSLVKSVLSSALGALTAVQLIAALWLPLLLLTIFVISALRQTFASEPNAPKAQFLSDIEISSSDEDLLDVRADAERFAKQVLNGGSKESMVFGLDAPWGAGKSSFVRLCEKWWAARKEQDVIVYKFNPLQYEDRKHLLSKFVDDLISVIRENAFIPELQPTISTYAELFKGERKVSLWGLEFTLAPGSMSIESAHDQVSQVLRALPQRLIVIVDDLDRMEFEALKDVLFVVKKCFSFPNVSFVLCYDTQNVATLGNVTYDAEKTTEFLEKFVNLKQGLFPTAETLQTYLNKGGHLTGDQDASSDRRLIAQAIEGLGEIYASEEYVNYLPLVGDVRKIKRLLNIYAFLGIGQLDFRVSDFNTLDLLHLVLIYLNFPSLFRIIYNAETGPRSRYFSATLDYNGGSSYYKNSSKFDAFMTRQDLRANEKLLLNKLFNVDRLDSKATSNVPVPQKRTLACFNDGQNGQPGNLSRYLQLIVSVAKPASEDSYRTFVEYKNRILGGEPVSILYQEPQFNTLAGDSRHEQLWRTILDSLEEFNAGRCASLILDALEILPRHSQLELKEPRIGMRQTLVYFLLKLVDTGGWRDKEGWHTDNTSENISAIARWLYGEGEFRVGILDTLMAEGRGPLGLNDTLIFRLYTCADRADSLFNLSRAVGVHSDPNTPIQGLTTDIARPQMREMSQWVFSKFKEQYILPRRSIFAEINRLSITELAGDFYDAVRKAETDGSVATEAIADAVDRTKSQIAGFCVYQLANTLVSSGVGCGYYDERGDKDQHGIFSAMNDYLWDVCFPSEVQGVLTFVDYALSQMRTEMGRRTRTFVPSASELLKALDPLRLQEFWLANRDYIKTELPKLTRFVKTSSYTASYSDDLPALIEELDRYAESPALYRPSPVV